VYFGIEAMQNVFEKFAYDTNPKQELQQLNWIASSEAT
jgi:hypothetical protein